MSRIRPRRACSSTCRSSSAPSGPISLNPAEMMIAPLTPASTHSPITPGHRRRGRDDDRQVDRLGHRLIVGIRLDAQHVGPLGVDRIDRAAERVADQVPEDGPADAAGLLGGADHRDRARREDRIERQPRLGRHRRIGVLGRHRRMGHSEDSWSPWSRASGHPSGWPNLSPRSRLIYPHRPIIATVVLIPIELIEILSSGQAVSSCARFRHLRLEGRNGDQTASRATV